MVALRPAAGEFQQPSQSFVGVADDRHAAGQCFEIRAGRVGFLAMRADEQIRSRLARAASVASY